MNRKKIPQRPPFKEKKFSPILSVLICAIISICGSIFIVPTTHAAGVPGGNIADSVVRAVDIAKPAIVRIITTIDGRLTVTIPNVNTATFPRDGGNYKLQVCGSGAFISSHGHILTADHVIRPSYDSLLDQALYGKAAQDVADYVNRNLNSSSPWTAEMAYIYLVGGLLPSRPQYNDPTSRVYLSTDYTGSVDASTIDDMPQGTYANVDQILKEEKGLPNGDTAIVHVNLEDTPSIKLGDSSNVAQQDELTIIGFPGNGDLPGKADPSIGFFSLSVNKIYVSAIKQTKNGVPLIQVGGNVERGDSGGPALDRNGNIMGIVSFGVSKTDTLSGTSFLQASETGQKLIKDLRIDTKPGPFQKAWRQAFDAYASTEPGHWHEAQTLFQQLQKKYAKSGDQASYPNFGAVKPFLNYVNIQASKESTLSQNTDLSFPPQTIVLMVVIVLALVIVVFLLLRRKPQVAISSPSLGYQPAQDENHPLPFVSPNTPVVNLQSQLPAYNPPSPYPQNLQQAWPPVARDVSISYPPLPPVEAVPSVQSSGMIAGVAPVRVPPHSEQFGDMEQKLPPPGLQVAPTLVSSPSSTPSPDETTIQVSPEIMKQITSGSIPVQPKEVIEPSQTSNEDDGPTLPCINSTQAENKND